MRRSCGFLGGVGGLLGIRRFPGGKPGFRRQPVRLPPLLVGNNSCTRRNFVLPGRIALRVAVRNDFEAGSWSVLRRSRKVRRSPPAHRLEDCRKLGAVVAGIIDCSKAGHIEVTIERAGPQRAAFGCAAGCSRLERGADPAAGLVARGVAGAREHIRGGTSRGLNSIAQPPRGGQEILSTLCPCGGVLVSVARIGSDRQKLGDQRRVVDGELVDRPYAHGRLAQLADGESRIPIRGSKFASHRRSPCDEVLQRAVVQAGGFHDLGV